MKPLFQKISIIGIGLIGGSIGLAVKKRKLARWVIGVARRKETAVNAVSFGVADVVTFDLAEGVRDADLVVLCAPVSTILKQMPMIKRHLKKRALVVDVGSSKEKIGEAAKKFLKGVNFVGCHPMAGSAQTGVAFADSDLFEGAQCFVTKNNAAINRFWKALGARPVVMNAKQHDAWVARVSYLPHILAFSLFQKKLFSSAKLKALNPSIQGLGRLSKSDAALWADIFLSNKETLKALESFEENLRTAAKGLKSGNTKALQKFIEEANRVSSKLIPDNSE